MILILFRQVNDVSADEKKADKSNKTTIMISCAASPGSNTITLLKIILKYRNVNRVMREEMPVSIGDGTYVRA